MLGVQRLGDLDQLTLNNAIELAYFISSPYLKYKKEFGCIYPSFQRSPNLLIFEVRIQKFVTYHISFYVCFWFTGTGNRLAVASLPNSFSALFKCERSSHVIHAHITFHGVFVCSGTSFLPCSLRNQKLSLPPSSKPQVSKRTKLRHLHQYYLMYCFLLLLSFAKLRK